MRANRWYVQGSIVDNFRLITKTVEPIQHTVAGCTALTNDVLPGGLSAEGS